jgi:hypothetical protein
MLIDYEHTGFNVKSISALNYQLTQGCQFKEIIYMRYSGMSKTLRARRIRFSIMTVNYHLTIFNLHIKEREKEEDEGIKGNRMVPLRSFPSVN